MGLQLAAHQPLALPQRDLQRPRLPEVIGGHTGVDASPIPVQKVAIVTGAGSGIGQCVALQLAKEDWAVVSADLNLDAAGATAAQIQAATGQAASVGVDIARSDACAGMADAALRAF